MKGKHTHRILESRIYKIITHIAELLVSTLGINKTLALFISCVAYIRNCSLGGNGNFESIICKSRTAFQNKNFFLSWFLGAQLWGHRMQFRDILTYIYRKAELSSEEKRSKIILKQLSQKKVALTY